MVTNLVTFAFWQIGEFLFISTVDDVAADAVVPSVTLDLGLISVVVLSSLVHDVAVLDLGEVEAAFLGASREV
jgi:hypothetical protein